MARSVFYAVGQVANECSKLEATVREIFCQLLGTSLGFALMSGEDLSLVTRYCQRLLPYTHRLTEQQATELRQLLDHANDLREARNFVVHAVWEPVGGGTHYAHQSKRLRTPKDQAKAPPIASFTRAGFHSADDVVELADAIRQLTEELDDYCHRNFEARERVPPFRRGFRILPEREQIQRPESAE